MNQGDGRPEQNPDTLVSQVCMLVGNWYTDYELVSIACTITQQPGSAQNGAYLSGFINI